MGDIVAVESDLKERGDFPFDEIKAGALVAIEDLQPDIPAPIASTNNSLSKTLEAGDVSQTVGESENNKLEVASLEVQVAENGFINEAPSYNEECSGETRKCFPYTEEQSNVQNASFNDGGNPSFEDVDPRSALDVGITAGDHASMECENIQVENDTEFLNADDDEVADNDDSIPCDEETRLLENSGWSSRTRAVANYLQTLFDKEAVNGRKVLLMDNLLSGKTRKEASRMFFETLVLKTKDYIHVEQAKPFENINIKARAKLMKSDF
ncbi:sister chromatid cohesion 1 protein 4-like isoform X2 [Carica papaya]|uniref:sister chromatid cohesion 1 protein 4-like isoform X2 n=1 Tax=Carica papaya TaxID=3649 RepID=UPI000B8CBFA2|nr:sister chromatid cohesion 1 protein 4-like isoform X2 [Carica papaya]